MGNARRSKDPSAPAAMAGVGRGTTAWMAGWTATLLLVAACGAATVPVPVGTVPGGTSTALEPSTGVESASGPATATTDPPTTTVPPTTTPPATTVEATATTTVPPTATTVPPARILRSPTALEPLRVMVLGDSVTYEIEPGLTAALQHTGLVVSANRTQMGFGLSQWPIFHWWEVWPPFLDEVRPEAVVLQAGIWDVQAVYGGERRLPRPEDPDWEAQYSFLVGVALDVLAADGAHVYWLTMLPSPDPGHTGRLNRLLVALAAGDDRMSVVDLTPGFTDAEGRYVDHVDRLGVAWPIRKVDGVHLCREGTEVAAGLAAAAILGDAGLEPEAGWEDGPWRLDPLYEVDPCDDPAPVGGSS